LAERHGFDSLWVGQHFPAGPVLFHPPSPLLILAAVAPQTGLTLGTGVLLLPMWHPVTLAYEMAVLDQLCGGRRVLDDAWYAGSTHHLSAIAETTGRYRAALAAAGKDPATARAAANRSTVIAETTERAWTDGGLYLETLMHTYRRIGGMRVPDGRPLTEDTGILPLAAAEVCLIGSSDDVSAQLEAYVAAGVTDVALRIAPSDIPLEIARRSIDLAGEHVIPRIR